MLSLTAGVTAPSVRMPTVRPPSRPGLDAPGVFGRWNIDSRGFEEVGNRIGNALSRNLYIATKEPGYGWRQW